MAGMDENDYELLKMVLRQIYREERGLRSVAKRGEPRKVLEVPEESPRPKRRPKTVARAKTTRKKKEPAPFTYDVAMDFAPRRDGKSNKYLWRCGYKNDSRIVPSLEPLIREDILEDVRFITRRRGKLEGKEGSRVLLYRSPIQGWGVYALKDIPKGTFLMSYTGTVVPFLQCDHLEQAYLSNGNRSTYFFRFSGKRVDCAIDATISGSLARFINHACVPNAFTRTHGFKIEITSNRYINAGEEISYNYKLEDDNSDARNQERCNCGCPGCKHQFL